MADIGTVIDALRPVLEPSPAADFTLDDSLARPQRVLPNVLYAWARSEAFVEDGVDLDQHRMTVRVAVAVANDGENALQGEKRSRTTSQSLFAKVQTYRTAIRTHRAREDELWSDAQIVSVNYDDVDGFLERGCLIDIALYSYAD